MSFFKQIRPPSAAMRLYGKIMRQHKQIQKAIKPPCDIFINHRGIDTKRTISGLLYDHLFRLGLRPFLDSKNLQPGDGLFDNINKAIHDCKVGVAVFSPRYCDSYFCLHELALIMETKKKVIPIFCDIKPSQLHVKDNGGYPKSELQRLIYALEEAKYTVGLTFNTDKGNWSEFLTTTTDAIMKNLIGMDHEEIRRTRR
ncbi:hypothetical protein K2173_004343 [Erythroxylum novogranatense]|uniref:TIR domain-containing protein n=1 Tax=Erythroxylum novogranatense TaxID=1862640 RepID=A0AAV8T4F8_9ROSI|nr:hypothetical protein K2173_004343 [Erythroxylum novogranatense]